MESTLQADSSVPLKDHDPTDLRFICLVKKHKMPFSDSCGFKNPVLHHELSWVVYGFFIPLLAFWPASANKLKQEIHL